MKLRLRPGAKECIEKLRAAGFTVRAFTMGDVVHVGTYFKNGGVDLPTEHLMSCDTSAIGKPDPAAYKPLLQRLRDEGDEPWFAAVSLCLTFYHEPTPINDSQAHMWDVSAAKRVGFKGAYCSVWENEALTEVFGELDVLADTLPEMADKIIAASQ